jgi:hypothetical protein
MSQSRNGVAALELQRHIGVKHYQTALRMTRMIRSMMDENAVEGGKLTKKKFDSLLSLL